MMSSVPIFDPEATFLTPEEVATICRVSPRTVIKWLQRGTLPGFRMGGHLWRVRYRVFYEWCHGEPYPRD